MKKNFFESIKNYIIELRDFISDNNNKKLYLYINKKFLEVLKVNINNLNNLKYLSLNHF